MHRFILSEWGGGTRSLGEFLLQGVNSGPAVSQDEPQSRGNAQISGRSSALAVFRKKTLSSYRIGSWQWSGAMDICSARVLRGSKHICSLRILRGSVHSLCAKDNIFISYFS